MKREKIVGRHKAFHTTVYICVDIFTVMAVELRHWSIRSLADPQKQIGFLSCLEEDHIVTTLHFAELVDHLKILLMFNLVLLL